MSLWDALRMNMMISYQELVRTFLGVSGKETVIKTSFFYGRQFMRQPHGGLILIELIARQHRPFDPFRPVHVVCGKHRKSLE